MGLKYTLIDMWANDQNGMIFSTSNQRILSTFNQRILSTSNQRILSTSNQRILYLTMLIVCRKNLSQSDRKDCKIITIEEEEKILFGGHPGSLLMF
jgi:hypothetical protein